MKDKKPTGEQTPYTGKTYAYIAVALTVLAAAAFGLMFTALGIYALIASLLLSLAALAFTGTQQKKNSFKGLIVIKVCAYAVLAAAAAVFIGGIIYSAV